jgi:hypothetical protein
LQTPQGKKTTGYSIPQGKTKSTETTSSGGFLKKTRLYSGFKMHIKNPRNKKTRAY